MPAEPPAFPDFDSRWDFAHPDQTEAEFRMLLPEASRSGEPDYHAQLLTQIARTQGLQMRFDEAMRTLDEAEAMISEAHPVARVRVLLERGRVLNSSRRRADSKPLFRAAWELARKAGADGFAVDAAHMLGIVEDEEASIEWNERAIRLAEASSDPKARRWLGSLYNNLGWTHHGKGRFEAALGHFREALAAREAEGDPGRIQIARWCIARTLRSLGRIEEALRDQQRLLEEGRASGSEDGFVREELAECLSALGRPEEAKPHFAAAYAALSMDEWLCRDEPERLERLRTLGGVAAANEPRRV